MASIVIADDHAVVRAGVRLVLEREADLKVAAEAGSGEEAWRYVQDLAPDVLVLDLSMPGTSGLEVARRISSSGLRTRMVVLSMHAGDASVFEAFKSGVDGYVLKDAAAGELVRAVRSVAAGHQYLTPPLSLDRLHAYAAQAVPSADGYERLSARERQVLELAADGRTNVEIADLLAISPRTIEAHRASLMTKLGLRGQQELLRYAIRRGITRVDQ
jgi:two-component system, NarL family, response regulator NreC